MDNNGPDDANFDVLSVAEMAEELFADAKTLDISSNEIEEDTGSFYQTVLKAILHQGSGSPSTPFGRTDGGGFKGAFWFNHRPSRYVGRASPDASLPAPDFLQH